MSHFCAAHVFFESLPKTLETIKQCLNNTISNSCKISQYVINLTVRFLIKRVPSVCINIFMWEYWVVDNYMSSYGKFYKSNLTINTISS